MTTRTRRGRALDAAIARLFRLRPGRYDYAITRDVRVPMRDGVDLLTDVYAPIEESRGTLLMRTPYGRTGMVTLITARYLATHGYRVVNQSCRGTYGSEGVFVPFQPDIEDGADTVAWLRRQSWFDGRFALHGTSYLGATAWALMMDPPPELITAVMVAAAHDNHWVMHGSGAFSLEQILGLFDGFGHLEEGTIRGSLRAATAARRLKPAFEELPLLCAQDTVLTGNPMPYREWLTSPNPEDPAWRTSRHGPALERVAVPILLQAGWQDRFPEPMIEEYEILRRRGVDVGLTIGPWTHVEAATKGWGLQMDEALDWLAVHLSGADDRRRPQPVRIYVTGADDWRRLPAWPPPTTEQVLHLHPAGGLDDTQPPSAAAPSTFRYDPADPTPAVGGRVINPAIGGYRDNRKLEARDDVLTFTGPPLIAPLEVIGNPVVELEHRTDNPYADLFVRLCEVCPNGRSTNLSDGFRRLDPATANGTIRIRLEALAHRFVPGTRIRLQISGGAHARFARNLGTGQDPATSIDLAPSTRMIAHGDGGFSRLLLPTSPLAATA